MKRTKIYDMDGTLIQCGIYYDQALDRAAKHLEALTQLPFAASRKLINDIDLAAVSLPNAFHRSRFPDSFAAAAYAALRLTGTSPGHPDASGIAGDLWNIGDAVFNAPYDLLDATVIETLKRDRASGWQLILYTKGDTGVQQLKIDRHNFDAYFDAIYIVPKKDVDTLRAIMHQNQVDLETSWMIGDSKKDDIAPAQEVGLKTALVVQGNHSWSYNDHVIGEPTMTVGSVSQVADGNGQGGRVEGVDGQADGYTEATEGEAATATVPAKVLF